MPSADSNHIQKSFSKDFLSLKAIFEFVATFASSQKLNDSQLFSLKFAIEEVFTNMVKYNPGTSEVTITMDRDGKKLKVGFVDIERKPFDITKKDDVNPSLPIEKRRPGGLGIFLIKKLMDDVEYSHDGIHSRITLTKFVE